MDPVSVLVSILTSLLIFMCLVFVYTCQSVNPWNAAVYHPKMLGKRVSSNWIREALSSTQQTIITTSGLDSAVYFIFYETVLKIFLSGMVLLPILLTLAATDTSTKLSNGTSSGTFDYLNEWSIGHIEENSLRLYAFVAATYWVSLFTINLLEKAYDRVSYLRAEALMSPEIRPEEFAVLVRDIPTPSQGQSRIEQVDSYFKELFPDSYFRCVVFLKFGKFIQVDDSWERLERCKKNLARAKAIYTEAPENTPKRPTIKTGFFGLIGEEVDSINYYNEKVKDLVIELKCHQTIALRKKKLTSALVFFTSRFSASCAAQSLINRRVGEWTVMHAPEFRQLLWTHLHLDSARRESQKYVICFCVFGYILCNVLFIVPISAFTTLDNLGELNPFLKLHIVDKYAIKIILEAFLPQVTLTAVMGIFAHMYISMCESFWIPSLSCVEKDYAGKHFFFTVFNVIIGVTGFGTLIASWKDIEKNPESCVSTIANSLSANASFFMTFVVFKSFVVYGLELSGLVPLAILHLKKKYICKTKADVKEACGPVSLGYARRLSSDMLVFAIVLCFSVISPIILPAGVLYFGIGWIVLRNQVLRVYVPSYETYGKMWPHINNHIFASLFVMQVMMLGYLRLKKCDSCVLLIIPLIMITLIYAWSFESRYNPLFKVRSLGVTCKDVMNTENMEKIVGSFIPPCMQDIEVLADEGRWSSSNAKLMASAMESKMRAEKSKMNLMKMNPDYITSSSSDSSGDELET